MNIMMPRLDMMTSLSTGGSPRSSKCGMSTVIVLSTMPTRDCCTKAFTRKRPMPGGLMAKLHSFVDSNSAACLSFITLRTSSIVCCGDNAVFDTGVILPSTFSAGGKLAVMKRSEPFCLTRSSRSSWMNLVARSRSMEILFASWTRLADRAGALAAGEQLLVDRAIARLRDGDGVAAHQLDQALVERLHADRLRGLNRRVHLRDLVLTDQVADRRCADHDLVRRHAPLAVLGLEQRLRDDRDQRLGEHRAHHVLFGSREHVDDAVDRLRSGARVQRAEHQVAGFCGSEREADGLQVSHFADQDVVRVLPQR